MFEAFFQENSFIIRGFWITPFAKWILAKALSIPFITRKIAS